MITRREFTRFGLGVAAFSASTHAILSANNNKNDVTSIIPPKEWTGSRRVGMRPNGTYWGGGCEQIDMLSGNLNYSIPMIIAGGRGVNVRIGKTVA